jgi:4-amino-4-deoxy-L-arabinose transferase-like glycosyltransferase
MSAAPQQRSLTERGAETRESAGTEPLPSVARGSRWQRCIDPAIFLALFAGYLGALLGSVKNLGYARDEGFYFRAASSYGKWFQLLWTDPQQALRASRVDSLWQENHEHPALMKSLFALSQRFFEGVLFEERGTAYRFPAMLLAALSVALIFLWGRRTYGRAGGLVAAIAFAGVPSVFYHSHLACFDLPIAAFWLLVAYAYQRSFETRRLLWGVASGLLYGLALETKHNSWLLPPALCAHVLLQHVLTLRRPWRRNWWRVRIPSALVFMLLLAPLVFYGLWPWIWRHTYERLVEYAQFHLQHVYYNIEFLGHTYFEPPFPRSYAWLLTLATVPASTLWLAAVGGIASARSYLCERRERARQRAAAELPKECPPQPASREPARTGAASLWLLCIFSSYSVWLSSGTPIFGGTKHWLPAYPFLALFAGAWLCGSAARAGAAARGVADSALATLSRLARGGPGSVSARRSGDHDGARASLGPECVHAAGRRRAGRGHAGAEPHLLGLHDGSAADADQRAGSRKCARLHSRHGSGQLQDVTARQPVALRSAALDDGGGLQPGALPP